MKTVKKIVALLTVCLVVSLMIYGGYKLERYINWSVEYEDAVEEKIKEMVKKEALK